MILKNIQNFSSWPFLKVLEAEAFTEVKPVGLLVTLLCLHHLGLNIRIGLCCV